MGDVIMLLERLAERSSSIGSSRSAFFFDLACPFSYLTAERVERTLGDVDWVACSLPRERGEPTPDVIARAERQALALGLPLVWPEVFPSGAPAALRAAAYASEMGAGPRFALAASRLAFCGGYDLEDRQILADAAEAADLPVDACLAAADDRARDVRLQATATRLGSCGVPRLPAIRIGRRWLWGEQMLSEARPLLRNAASYARPNGTASTDRRATAGQGVTLPCMRDPVDRAVRAIARRHPFALLWAQFSVTHLVMLGGMGILRLYQPMSAAHFWLLVGLSQVLVGIDNVIAAKLTYKLLAPVRAWERGRRDEQSTIDAWRALVALPLDLMRRLRSLPLLFLYFPFVAFATWLLDLPWYSFLLLSVVGSVVVAYGLIFRYFAMEITVRPVLERIAQKLPKDCALDAPALPLRWRLLVAGPVINVITGVVVAGLATHGHHEKLSDLGVAWLIAVGVAFTISLELVVLTVRALGSSLRDMQRATERVSKGDLTARVPVVATDETGRLAESFNSMVGGLQERERLREAFGAYVDPGVAERVLREGSDLTGDEVEVSVLFLDIREFTRFAERSEPHEVVSFLNGFWDLVVPVLLEHGGHANKFIGDGVLAVFGAPARLPDHAACAVEAALEIAERVADHYDGQIGVGIGVNSGPVVAGTVGGGGRVEFTVIGDTVNTAARVEAATRATGDDVLITESTRKLLPAGRFEFEERPPVPLKGKRTEVRLWTPRMLSAASRSRRRPQSAVAD